MVHFSPGLQRVPIQRIWQRFTVQPILQKFIGIPHGQFSRQNFSNFLMYHFSCKELVRFCSQVDSLAILVRQGLPLGSDNVLTRNSTLCTCPNGRGCICHPNLLASNHHLRSKSCLPNPTQFHWHWSQETLTIFLVLMPWTNLSHLTSLWYLWNYSEGMSASSWFLKWKGTMW